MDRLKTVHPLVLLVAAAGAVAVLSYLVIVVLGVGSGPSHATP